VGAVAALVATPVGAAALVGAGAAVGLGGTAGGLVGWAPELGPHAASSVVPIARVKPRRSKPRRFHRIILFSRNMNW
jgi:hypothetical protein